jgi:hypothetical protein
MGGDYLVDNLWLDAGSGHNTTTRIMISQVSIA